MRKRLGIGIAILALGGVQALAADVPAKAPVTKATAAAPLFNWSGFYYGVAAGYGWGASDHVNTATGAASGDLDPRGWMLGGTVGANWQSGALVGGAEADLSWTSIDGSGGSAAACAATCVTELDWFGTGRVRAGYAADAYLFYLTGGAAFGRVKAGQAGLASSSDTRVGWTAGAGVEAAVTRNWTTKLEYLYVDLGDKTAYTTAGGPHRADYTSHIGRVGMNYRF